MLSRVLNVFSSHSKNPILTYLQICTAISPPEIEMVRCPCRGVRSFSGRSSISSSSICRRREGGRCEVVVV